jgi:translation initiation factor IF-1
MGDGSTCALTATVLELLPNGGVRVELDNRERVLAHPAGALETNFVRLRPNDRVLVELAPGDRGRCRIIQLLRER